MFLDAANTRGDIVLMNAYRLGTTVKKSKNQKILLSDQEEQKIIDMFNRHEAVEDFLMVLSYKQIAEKNYSFSEGQYFKVKIEYTDITANEFKPKWTALKVI